MKTNKYNLNCFLHDFKEIVIPDIQRDYTMGSIGENLENLLSAINTSAEKNRNFNFSCIMGCAEQGNFHVYDGQQRLTTLIYLSAYILCHQGCGAEGENYRQLLKRFQFQGREEANRYLQALLNGYDKLDVCDFTTFSIHNLLQAFKNNAAKLKYITIDFLMKQIVFDIVQVKNACDAEQFFIDLNEGLKLEQYEIYKAEMNHKIWQFYLEPKNKPYKEKLKDYLLKIDNEWLEFFLANMRYGYCEEELEVEFIKYCFRMRYIELNGNDLGYLDNDIEWIEAKDVIYIYDIIEKMVKSTSETNEPAKTNYSSNYLNAQHWNLSNSNYKELFKDFLGSFVRYSSSPDKNEFYRKYDIVLWCYISSWFMEYKKRVEYLRFIKKLLNQNRFENKLAIYHKNGEITFTKYLVFAVAPYYRGSHKSYPDTYQKNIIYLWDVLSINSQLKEIFAFSNWGLLDSININNNIISKILKREKAIINNVDAVKFENSHYFNGIIDNVLDISGNLIISYESFLKKVSGKSIGDFYRKLCSYDFVFKYICVDNIEVGWYTYFDSYDYQKQCSIIIHDLTDFFTNDYGENLHLIQKCLLGAYNQPPSQLNKKQLYLKYYSYIPTSWLYMEKHICFINENERYSNHLDKPRKAGLLSVNSTIPKSKNSKHCIYCSENKSCDKNICKLESVSQWIEYNLIKFSVDKDLTLVTAPTCGYGFHEKTCAFLVSYISANDISEIYYSPNNGLNNALLADYVDAGADNLNDLQTMVRENKEIIRKIFHKHYFFEHDTLAAFVKSKYL